MKSTKEEQKYIDWIKHQPCYCCGGFDVIDNYGDPLVTPSHIKTRGSGGAHFDNLVPMRWQCHQRFEVQTKHEKRKLLPLAKRYTEKYRQETS